MAPEVAGTCRRLPLWGTPWVTKIVRNRLGALTLRQGASKIASKGEKVSPWGVKGAQSGQKGA